MQWQSILNKTRLYNPWIDSYNTTSSKTWAKDKEGLLEDYPYIQARDPQITDRDQDQKNEKSRTGPDKDQKISRNSESTRTRRRRTSESPNSSVSPFSSRRERQRKAFYLNADSLHRFCPQADVGGQHCPCPVLVSFCPYFPENRVQCLPVVRIRSRFQKKTVCMSGWTRTRQSCPDFHCPPTSGPTQTRSGTVIT